MCQSPLPRLGWQTAAFSFLAVCAVIAAILFGNVEQKARVHGHMIPASGLNSTLSPASGTITFARPFPEVNERGNRCMPGTLQCTGSAVEHVPAVALLHALRRDLEGRLNYCRATPPSGRARPAPAAPVR